MIPFLVRNPNAEYMSKTMLIKVIKVRDDTHMASMKIVQLKVFKIANSKLFWRSSRSQMFFKIGVLKNFANLTGKHLCWSIYSIRTPFLQNTSGGCKKVLPLLSKKVASNVLF